MSEPEAYELDHIAFGVLEIGAVTEFLVGDLGGRPFEAGPGIEFMWWQWRFARGGTLEVLEPDGPPGGFVHRFLETRGPGVHHVTFKVPDLAATAARVRSLGFEIVSYSDAMPSWKECFLHPKQAHGIVVQLAESHPELGPEDLLSRPFPESPPAAREPADVLGLRLSARSESEARHQWGTVLGGTCRSTDSGVSFRWAGSPLRIDVRIDPAAAEGPLAIEVAAPLPRGLPEGPHPVLGIPFLPVATDDRPASPTGGS
jgi:methylmalonyl-CoA/ethylmalonyl-CoA epimerase